MSISGIQAGNNVDILRTQNLSGSTAVKSNSLNEVSDEFTESDETSKFKEIVGKYDITNMSRNELNTMYNELCDNKLIDFKDCTLAYFHSLTLDFIDSPDVRYNGAKLPSDPDEKVNFLDIFQTQADWTKKYGDSQSKKISQSVLELAEKINYFQSWFFKI